MEDKISITIVIDKKVKYKKYCTIQFNLEIQYLQKAMDFYLLLKIWVKILVKKEVRT